jgi:2-oxo-3-hexenedioate decarboxylase
MLERAFTKESKRLMAKPFSKLTFLLDAAYVSHREIKPLTTIEKDLTLDQAYEIQSDWIKLRVTRGEKLIGYKMGFTSKAKMEQMGLHSPIHGELTDLMQIKDGGTFSLKNAIHPKIEPEIAFVTKTDLGGHSTREEIIEGLAFVKAGLEILDSRYEGFKYFSLPDVVADNGSAHSFAVSHEGQKLSGLDLSNLQMSLAINGHVVHSARSDAILGNPVESVIELCKMLGARSRIIKAGSVILAGASTPAVALEKGMTVSARVAGLDDVTITVTE